jgi:16S rRNA (adenine1518-N6/adenine1519-N6)-dimethyltransferase
LLRRYSPRNDEKDGEKSLLSRTKDLLREYGLQARKGLGQHFLVNSGILNMITGAAELSPSDLVLEVGPGIGILTRELVGQAGWVIAVELDTRLAEMVKETLLPESNFSIINTDVLKVEPLELIQQEKGKFPAAIADPLNYKLVANIPYYITQPIIRHFCEAKLKPRIMVIMVQKEVAKNIIAQPGDLSLLAISVQYYGKPEIVGYVPARNFYPAPKVDSAILKITMYPKPPLIVTSEKSFFKIVRAGFCARRKQVANSLAQGLDIPKPEVLSLMEKTEVIPQKRPETLTLEEWAHLEKIFTEAKII